MASLLTPPGIILINPKYEHNVGAALRACSAWGIYNLLWTGQRVVFDQDTTKRIPREERMKGYKDVKWLPNVDKPLNLFENIVPVAIEIKQGSESLTTFEHPENAVYLFGPEDGSIPQVYSRLCHRFVHMPSHHCLNLSAAVNVVLYDRRMKRQRDGLEEVLPLHEVLHEHRGVDTPTLTGIGWDGK